MGALRVWPSEEALEEQLARELPAGAARALAGRDVGWGAFVDRLGDDGGPRLDPVTGRLLLRVAAEQAGWPATSGYLDAAAQLVAEAERAALAPAELAAVGRLGEVYAAFLRGCERAGASADRRRGRARLCRVDAGVEIHIAPRSTWEPWEVETVLALARAARVIVRVPWGAGRPEVFAGMEPVLRAFESRGDAVRLDVIAEDPADAVEGTMSEVLAALYRPGARVPAPESAPPGVAAGVAALAIRCAPHARAELRTVAAHARGLVDAGCPPEAIAVAARAPGDIAGRLAEELARVGLSLEDRRGSPLSAAPPARLALALLELGARGWPREEVLAVIASRYLVRRAPAAAVRRARELGLRELAPGGPGLARLGAVGAPVAETLRVLSGQPDKAPLAEHGRWLRRALDGLGVGARARALDPGAAGTGAIARSLDRAVERALARDQAAMAALERLLDGLPRAAARAGFVRDIGQEEAAGVLADLMRQLPLRPHGVRGGAVRLVSLEDLAARRFEHVILPRLLDGMAPARGRDDGSYGDRERRAVNRALGRRALPSFAAEEGAAPAERTPFETLLLVQALAAARRSVLLTYPASDGDRVATRSPFVDEVERVAPWARLPDVPLSPIPQLGAAAAPADVLARVALEAWADPAGRIPPTPAAAHAGALLAAATGPLGERLARVDEVAAIERARWRFASGAEAAGPFMGVVGGAAVAAVPAAAARVSGAPDAPLPARQLERYARCPFTFLAGRLLGVEPPDEAEDQPSARNLGLVAHRCLERFYRARAAAGALPLKGDDADRAALAAACAEAFAEVEARGQPGHPVLWELEKEELVDDLWRWIQAEAAGTEWGGVPSRFELPFGLPGPGALPALVWEGVHVSGRIDRLDTVAGGKAMVVDYKLRSLPRLQAELRAAVEGPELQLPLYLAAVERGLGVPADAAFVSLRAAKATRTLRKALGGDAGELLGPRLEERVAELAAGMRAGGFAVRPHDRRECTRCSYRTVCRVTHLAEEAS
jgi:ATP-dependent helicase/nuclease subunit B